VAILEGADEEGDLEGGAPLDSQAASIFQMPHGYDAWPAIGGGEVGWEGRAGEGR
jgi:hypothetical protein